MSEHPIPALRRSHLAEITPSTQEPEIIHDSSWAVRIQQMLFEEATALDASDVHIEPRTSNTFVRYRVHGLMKEGLELPRWMHENLVARIKILAKLDISERRVPQDGHIASDGESPDIRVSVLPTKTGEKVVLRMLRKNRAPRSLPDLNLSPNVEETLRALTHRPQGLILVVGPTGSGKTTTLYSMVHEICREPLNIVTIEDPIEYQLDRITQVQVHDKAGLTFARALRAILRQDPDVILVGEIRDAETAKIAFEASMTGHLVLSTLHTTDSASALSRLTELGVTPDLIANGTAAVIAQRLVRENCTGCNDIDFPRPMYLKRLGIADDENARFRRGVGCPVCNFTGVRGRAGLYEVMEVTREIRRALMNGSEEEIRYSLKESGIKTLTEQALGAVAEGRLSVAEAYRTCYFGGGLDA
jgi:type II secretory ATPase GspE/PulE/Tfp pilus assembly ATPase PilB-like protein